MKQLLILILLIYIAIANANTLSHTKVIEICNHYNEKELLNVDCNLVSTLARSESSYKIESYHPEKSGSYGILQVQCSTAKQMGLKFGCEQLFGPWCNVRFGMKYLAWIKNQLPAATVKDILAVWNAGFDYTHGLYVPRKCKHYNEFRWQGFPPVECYPGEYINEEYVWKVYRRYNYISNRRMK